MAAPRSILCAMPREVRNLDITIQELGARIDAAADREANDEPYLDADFNPITPEQVLEHIRELERRTGERMIFRRGERPGHAA
jgi:hypothetical protein